MLESSVERISKNKIFGSKSMNTSHFEGRHQFVSLQNRANVMVLVTETTNANAVSIFP